MVKGNDSGSRNNCWASISSAALAPSSASSSQSCRSGMLAVILRASRKWPFVFVDRSTSQSTSVCDELLCRFLARGTVAPGRQHPAWTWAVVKSS